MKGVIQFFFVAFPKVAGGACTLAANIILLRYFGPEQFGRYSLCVTGIILADAIIGSAVDMGVIRLAPLYQSAKPELALEVQQAALRFKAAAVLAALIVAFVLGRPISRIILHDPEQANLLQLSCVGALGLLALRSAQVWLQIRERFFLYGMIDFLHMTLKFGGIALLLAFNRATPAVVLSAFCLAPAVAFAFAVYKYSPKLVAFEPLSSSAYRELLGFVGWFTATFALTSLVGRLDIFLLTAWSDIRSVGIFAAGQAFAMIPEMLGVYLSVVLAPKVGPYCRDGRFAVFFRKSQLLLMSVAVVAYVVIAGVFSRFGATLLPTSFLTSSRIVLILLPGTLAAFVSFPLTYTFLMFVRPRFLFMLDACALPLLIPIYYWAILNHGGAGAAWVTGLSRVAKGGVAQIMAWRSARSASVIQERIVTPEMSRAAVQELT
jgi:O-antigen/teichoic acid export membrane protein